MSAAVTRFRCHGCGAVTEADGADPFRCPRFGEGDVDHVLVLDRSAPPAFPAADDPEDNPFLRYLPLFHFTAAAAAAGLPADDVAALVRDLDRRVARLEGRLDGRGFRVTPCDRSDALSDALGFATGGGVWVKDETGQIGGSHKARHLFGVLVHLEAQRFRGDGVLARRPLAIASCGNAALAAGVVARAGGRDLTVFVPPHADGSTLNRLRSLRAEIETCERAPGGTGDPCVHAFRAAVADGALPFTCQGNENGLAIEGGHPLGWEMAEAFAARGEAIDHVVVQVGGGALASAVAAGLRDGVAAGLLPRLPRLHTVQTEAAHPLRRAHDRVAKRMRERGESVEEAMRYAATHRSAYMWPWETEPRSLAEGILDDETYDWWEVLRATLESGGSSVVVDEDRVRRANELAREADFAAGFTGSSALAGVAALRGSGVISPGERTAILMTGVRRGRGG